MRIQVLAATVITLFAAPVYAQWQFVAFGGAGFSGRNVERAIPTPVYSNKRIVADSADLVKDASWDWRPSITSGLELRRALSADTTGWYLGIAGFFSALNEADDKTSLFPGVAITLGKGKMGLILGYIATASNEVVLPPGGLRIARSQSPDVTTEGTKSFGRIYIGFRGVEIRLQ